MAKITRDAIRTEWVPVDDVQPHPENPNQGDAGAISLSLDHMGQYRAIVVSTATGNIVAGNHTYLAGRMNGDTEMYMHLVDDLTPEDERRIMVADNQYARLAVPDAQGLADLLTDLAASDDGLTATGYDGDLLDDLLADLVRDDAGRDGDVTEPPADPVTKLGDVWQLGPHTLTCGDATDPDAWRLDQPFDLLWTDPPYGVSYADKNEFLNNLDKGNHIQDEIRLDHQTPAEMTDLWTAAFTAALSHAKDTAAYYTTGPQGGDLLLLLLQSIKDAGWQLKHMLVWIKSGHVLGRSDYHYQHEPVLYGWNRTHNWYGDHSQTTTLHVPKPSVNDLHPTMKPVELVERCITNSTRPNDLIADPFAGSGTTLIAADNLGRVCHAVELDPAYCDVIIARWESLNPDNEAERI